MQLLAYMQRKAIEESICLQSGNTREARGPDQVGWAYHAHNPTHQTLERTETNARTKRDYGSQLIQRVSYIFFISILFLQKYKSIYSCITWLWTIWNLLHEKLNGTKFHTDYLKNYNILIP